MTYPPVPSRLASYRQAENAGLPLDTAQIDAEFNNFVEIVGQLVARLKLYTDPSGRLTGVASALAMALAGADRYVATAAQTVFPTTVVWDSAFSNLSVTVNIAGLELDPNLVAVADNGGFLEVTITPTTPVGVGQIVVIQALSAGAGIATRLADDSSGSNGANMVGVQDATNYFVGTTVEMVLAEIMLALNTLTQALGTVGDIWTKQGLSIAGDPASAAWDLGAQKITNMADGSDASDAVTVGQISALTAGISDLLNIFIRNDGAVAFIGDQSMGGFKLTDLGAPTAGTDATNKTYVDAADAAAATAAGVLDAENLKRNGTVALRKDWIAGVAAHADDIILAVPALISDGVVIVKNSVTLTYITDWNYDGTRQFITPTVTRVAGDVFSLTKNAVALVEGVDWWFGTRQIKGLMAGTDPHDAVTVEQFAGLSAVQVLTGSGTFTPDATGDYLVEMTGGGGGGGDGATNADAAGGGGAGTRAVFKVTLTAATPYTYACGAGGGGGSSGGAGSAGGTTSFDGTTYRVRGGKGGAGGAGAVGGAGGAGDPAGEAGVPGPAGTGIGGDGGRAVGNGLQGNGGVGVLPGAGGGGSGGTGTTGGAGAAGQIIVSRIS